MQTVTLTKKQENELNSILNELIIALKNTYTEEDISKLVYHILKESSIKTYTSKKDITVNTFKSIGSFSGKMFKLGKEKVNLYRQNGWQTELDNDLNNTSNLIKNSPNRISTLSNDLADKISSFNENFLNKSKDEKIELLAVGLMGVLIFYASAGGNDFEGGIPDTDLMIGIGYHRHIFSHSIITGIIVEIIMRSGIEILNKIHTHLPKEHHIFWDNCNMYINKHKGIAVGAMWAGISIHLLKDSGIFGHGVKPYTGIPFEMSMNAHQGLFAANGTASALISTNKF